SFSSRPLPFDAPRRETSSRVHRRCRERRFPTERSRRRSLRSRVRESQARFARGSKPGSSVRNPSRTRVKKLFPIYLQLRDRTVGVIGAGRVAERRLRRLLDTEATIRVVAPQATPAIEEWDRKGRIALARRPFEPSDLDGAQL